MRLNWTTDKKELYQKYTFLASDGHVNYFIGFNERLSPSDFKKIIRRFFSTYETEELKGWFTFEFFETKNIENTIHLETINI